MAQTPTNKTKIKIINLSSTLLFFKLEKCEIKGNKNNRLKKSASGSPYTKIRTKIKKTPLKV
ncbi:hypothetical protein MAH1_12450 [Sessilibacter sp. MAH1]